MNNARAAMPSMQLILLTNKMISKIDIAVWICTITDECSGGCKCMESRCGLHGSKFQRAFYQST